PVSDAPGPCERIAPRSSATSSPSSPNFVPMSSHSPITLQLDRRILEHPRAYHLRRMRAGLWLYLVLLARLPAGADTFEVEPAAIGRDMGLPEGTIRSWLGHLRRSGYLEALRLNGKVRVTIRHVTVAESSAA